MDKDVKTNEHKQLLTHVCDDVDGGRCGLSVPCDAVMSYNALRCLATMFRTCFCGHLTGQFIQIIKKYINF